MNSLTGARQGSIPVSETTSGRRVQGELLLTLVYIALCLASLVPFVAVAHPPIVDFANHAARLDLACHLDSGLVRAMYDYHLGVIPNLAVDLVNAPLCGHASPDTVLKLVTAASLLLIYFSAWQIQRRLFGEVNAFLLMVPAMAFNIATTMGYMNFLAGIAVVMLMVALAVQSREQFRSLLILCNLGGVIVFFCHVFALAAAILVFLGLFLAQRPVTPKSLLDAAWRTALCFAVPIILFAFVPSGGHHMAVEYEGTVRTFVALFMAQQDSAGVYAFLLAIPLYLLVRRRLVELEPLFARSLALLAIYVLVVPNQISEAVDIDSRTFVALAYLLFSTLRPVGRVRELSLTIASIAALLVALQLWAMVAVWQPFSRQVDEFRGSLAALPEGARVFAVSADREGPRLLASPMSYSHVTSYATIDRRIFNPLEFTGVGMQPLSVRPAFAGIDTPAGQPFSASAAKNLARPNRRTLARAQQYHVEYALRWPEQFDYVVYYHFGGPPNFDPTTLEVVRVGSFFSILKVKRAVVGA